MTSFLDSSLAFGIDLALKAFLLWLLAASIAFAIGSRRAVARSLVWHACLLSWAVLPLSLVCLPAVHLAWLPEALPHSNNVVSDNGQTGSRTSILDTAAGLYESAVLKPRLGTEEPSRVLLPASHRAAASGRIAPPIQEGERSGQPSDWRVIIVAIYAFGASWLLLQLVVSHFVACKLGKSGFTLRGEWERRLEEGRAKLGLARPVRVACSNAVEVPIAIGWTQPAVVLPPSLLRPSARKHRESVLLHELAHIRRGDYLWQVAARAILALYWPLPFAWCLVRSIERAREEACDDLTLSLVGSARRYRAALIDAARRLARRRSAITGIAMVRSSDLGDRLRRIESGGSRRGLVVSRPLKASLVGTLVLLGVCLGSAELRRPGAAQAELPPARLNLRVVERDTGHVIAGARVRSWLQGDRLELESDPTDIDGWTAVAIPARAGWKVLCVRIRKEGYAPLRLSWNESEMGTLLPEYELALEGGATIGGRVVDGAGSPIQGASVLLSASWKASGEVVDFEEETFTTDVDGVWRCEAAPSDLSGIKRRVIHPDHLHLGPGELDPEKARSREDVVVLQRGPVLEGRILGPDGKPLAGARVREGNVVFRTPTGKDLGKLNEVSTDRDGRFRLGSAGSGALDLLIQADGCSPLVHKVAVPDHGASLELRLERGRTILGRVVDPSGAPVVGALVEVSAWRRTRLDWTAVTGANGRFQWNSAPRERVMLLASKRGWRRIHSLEVEVSDEEVALTLSPVPRMGGRVLDAESKAPVELFNARVGAIRNDRPVWEDHVLRLSKGRYDIAFTMSDLETSVVRIEAEGYLPAVSRMLSPDEGDQAFDFLLFRGEKLRGIVRDRDGKPVTGADVHKIEGRVRMIDGKVSEQLESGRSAEDGSFELPPGDGQHRILVLAEKGYAVVTKPASGARLEIELEPWAAIHGEVRAGGIPRASEVVGLKAEAAGGAIEARASALTSAEGRFRFERVFPGEAEISQLVNLLPRSKRPHLQPTRKVKVNAVQGETGPVFLEGSGMAVMGQFVKAPDSTGELGLGMGYVTLHSKEVAEGSQLVHAGRLGPDGAFRIEDVNEGGYELSLRLYEEKALVSRGHLGQELASLNREVTVASRAGVPDVLDLGTLEVTVHRVLGPGILAPPLEATTLDGKLLRLEDYRGKLVLLDFWATWCVPCVREIPQLKQLHERFRSDDRFTIIGLSFDENIDTLRTFVRRHRIEWPQVALGTWSDSKARAAYGVSVIPRMLLIGANGKIVLMNIPGVGAGIEEVIAEELRRK